MPFTNRDLVELTAWRRKLHRQPEISNEEEKTAAEVVAFLADTGPDKVLTGLGGHGVAAIYDSGEVGPTVMFRSELGALPIHEVSGVPHVSLVPGKGHMCGHDGHTAILAALGRQLGRRRPARGRVVLMFQPAEETGNGAAGVVADPRFGKIAPDFAFSLHNLPGVPFGVVRLTDRRRQLRLARHAHPAGGQDRAFLHARDRRLAGDGDQRSDAGAARAWQRNLR